MRLVVTRPSGDSEELATVLRHDGHDVIVEPLLEIVPRETTRPILSRYQGLLVTSANGMRYLAVDGVGPGCLGLPVYAVGDASRDAARQAGFSNVESAAGDLAALVALVRERVDPESGPLLYPTGSKVAGDLRAMLGTHGYAVERAVLYDAVPVDRLKTATAQALERGGVDGVLLFSPRTAAIWTDLVCRSGLAAAAAALNAFCLSRAVAEKVHDGLSGHDANVQTSRTPDLAGMLALLRPD